MASGHLAGAPGSFVTRFEVFASQRMNDLNPGASAAIRDTEAAATSAQRPAHGSVEASIVDEITTEAEIEARRKWLPNNEVHGMKRSAAGDGDETDAGEFGFSFSLIFLWTTGTTAIRFAC